MAKEANMPIEFVTNQEIILQHTETYRKMFGTI